MSDAAPGTPAPRTRDVFHLLHIAETAARIERSVAAGSADALATDQELRDATAYRLHTLAESAGRLSAELKSAHPEIPWKDIAGFRNRVVHDFVRIDVEVVRDVIHHDLPPLRRVVQLELDRSHQRERLQRGPQRSRAWGRGDRLGSER